MKIILNIALMVSAMVFCLEGISQKRVSEITIVYDNFVSSGKTTPDIADSFDGATTTVYIKGNMSRQDMVSALYSSSTIHNAKNNTAVLLKEVSGQKILIRLDSNNLKEKNKHLQGIRFEYINESKVIAGYQCKKATATLADGSSFTVFYTNEIVPDNKEYDQYFTQLNGLPLEYELVKGTLKIKFVVSSINLSPIPASKFEIPSSGYREMQYEESRRN
ncbi:hypothetical protein [Gynurincola endophyticus]|uniref:hypothetical protein n=1 Tax=Gynurincola endophyticus TaxID=2479004 RepID=UPI000F8DB42C|nr:hypothetical protein [Gynurincola endophyticus]